MPAQILCFAIGLSLLVAPAVTPHTHSGALVAQIFGPLIAAVAVVAAWGALRSLRWLNAFLGLGLILAQAIIGAPGAAGLYGACSGMLIVLLSLVPAPRGHGYAGGWQSLL